MAVAPGDRIFLYTDGLVERFGARRQSVEQGTRRLLALADEARELPLDRAVDRMVEACLTPGEPQQDDVVLLGMEV
jgi:sigma-B regulation protein RsbU (phosphoserine phosphatase)